MKFFSHLSTAITSSLYVIGKIAPILVLRFTDRLKMPFVCSAVISFANQIELSYALKYKLLTITAHYKQHEVIYEKFELLCTSVK